MEQAILIFAIGFLSGMIANELFHHLKKACGILRIDHSNPDKDTYRFEIDNLDELSKKKIIVLKVDNNADLSQR